MEFTRRGLTYAQTVLGVPGIPVTTVHLRLSVAISPTGALRTNFQLTETTDAEYGEFTVYMGCEPGDYAFYGQLTHEICHLLNANLHDAYAEGICTAFAERFLRAQGYDWSRWMAFFDQGLEPLYAVTYGMMREIWNLVGDLQIGNLLTCARYTPDGSGKMHLDVTTWLATLSEEMRCKVLGVINRYKAHIERQIEITGIAVSFETPSPNGRHRVSDEREFPPSRNTPR